MEGGVDPDISRGGLKLTDIHEKSKAAETPGKTTRKVCSDSCKLSIHSSNLNVHIDLLTSKKAWEAWSHTGKDNR